MQGAEDADTDVGCARHVLEEHPREQTSPGEGFEKGRDDGDCEQC